MQDCARGEEQQALEEGVVHRVVETRGDAEGAGKTHSSQHIADLGDGVVGQQALKVMLGKGHRDADEHGDAADEHQHELHTPETHGLEQEIGKTHDAVDAGLREHAGDQHRNGRGGRAVGVRRQGVEGHDKGLGAEADVQKRKRELCGVVHRAGDQTRQLREVQGVVLGVEQDDAGEDGGGAHAAHDQVLERRLQRAVDLRAEGGQRHRREGEDLDHDEHVEDVAGEDEAQHAAREQAVQHIVLGHAVVVHHVADGVDGGDEDRRGNEQGEEEAERVDFQGNADGVAAGNAAGAHPVGDDLSVEHDGPYKGGEEAETRRGGDQGDPGAKARGVIGVLRGLPARGGDDKRAEEEHHDRVDREVMVICHVGKVHPLSLLISLVSRVP